MSEEVPPFAHSTPLLGMKPGGWGRLNGTLREDLGKFKTQRTHGVTLSISERQKHNRNPVHHVQGYVTYQEQRRRRWPYTTARGKNTLSHPGILLRSVFYVHAHTCCSYLSLQQQNNCVGSRSLTHVLHKFIQ